MGVSLTIMHMAQRASHRPGSADRSMELLFRLGVDSPGTSGTGRGGGPMRSAIHWATGQKEPVKS